MKPGDKVSIRNSMDDGTIVQEGILPQTWRVRMLSGPWCGRIMECEERKLTVVSATVLYR